MQLANVVEEREYLGRERENTPKEPFVLPMRKACSEAAYVSF